jgi:plasmid maintenance system killer protein
MSDPFADAFTRAVYHGAPRVPAGRMPYLAQRLARRRMDMLRCAATLADLRSARRCCPEPMPGGLAAPFSLRVQGDWRLEFQWSGSGAHAIRLTRRRA